ncbi:exosortase/archaeosortase family protein [Agaribacter flavus]|uniref:Exosortase/archaeosortase family protein n=1 Tax=Agaribacter flavus TaxID=1902781 RepID=A0ABV7FU64_9ALTE
MADFIASFCRFVAWLLWKNAQLVTKDLSLHQTTVYQYSVEYGLNIVPSCLALSFIAVYIGLVVLTPFSIKRWFIAILAGVLAIFIFNQCRLFVLLMIRIHALPTTFNDFHVYAFPVIMSLFLVCIAIGLLIFYKETTKRSDGRFVLHQLVKFVLVCSLVMFLWHVYLIDWVVKIVPSLAQLGISLLDENWQTSIKEEVSQYMLFLRSGLYAASSEVSTELYRRVVLKNETVHAVYLYNVLMSMPMLLAVVISARVRLMKALLILSLPLLVTTLVVILSYINIVMVFDQSVQYPAVQLSATHVAPMSKNSFHSPELNQMLISLLILGSTLYLPAILAAKQIAVGAPSRKPMTYCI